MKIAIGLLCFTAACTTSAPEIAAGGDLTGWTSDATPAGDLARASGDGAMPKVDQAQPAAADLAQAGDLASCGGLDEPCCSAQVCVASMLPAGSYCPQGTCSGGASRACRMIGTAPTCEPCGGSGQWCCPGASPCLFGGTCAGMGSINAGHCS